ncbi:hypothetical protein AT959_15655 [Dechloromonas denitrificans]|uniref:Outer membrane protein beta-barrel domain-containing protein n=1 Tax=Dechloromonas denitrificans TaxID=281362 RepID=A0A133XEM4_9RHOO|nr:hypothetical protein [Dechloromonas denitrificans]KXB29397.1 hypothetical protein AT959_15655 [Dechloromonas denitrificans]
MTTVLSKTVSIASAALAGLLLPVAASAQEPAGGWQFSVMPYLWLPGVKADLKYGPPAGGTASANVDADENDVLSSIQMMLMIAGEARKGPWLVATDFVYLDLGNTESKVKSVDFNPGSGPVNVSTTQIGGNANSSFKGSVWTLAGGYALISEPAVSLDVLAGFRYLDLEVSSSWNLNAAVSLPNSTMNFNRSGSARKSQDITTFIVGAKGRFKLGQSDWFVPYYADFGGDGSAYTWQVASGLGYAFKWGDVRLDYRHLAYGQDDDKLLHKIELGGFALGANFRF